MWSRVDALRLRGDTFGPGGGGIASGPPLEEHGEVTRPSLGVANSQ